MTLFEYRGISENELEDILSIDDELLDSIFIHHHPPVRRFQIGLFSRLKYELKDYIINKVTDDQPVVAWYHRAFIEASNEYLKDYLTNEKYDKLIKNVIDYYTEKWNVQKKPFSFKKKSKLLYLKIQFPDYFEINGEIEFKSFRDTASQVLEINGRFNKRKLNEFIFLIEKLKDENLRFEIMKEHFYNNETEQNFFSVYQNYAFYESAYDGQIFSENDNLKLVLAASYFNHLKIFEWLKDEQKMNINDKNQRGESSLHIGIFKTVRCCCF